MSDNRYFYKFLSIMLILTFGYIQLIEYNKVKDKLELETKVWLDDELKYLESKSREMKQKAQITTKIETLLGKFERNLEHDPAEIARIIFMKSQEYNIDPLLVMGVIRTESNFFRHAKSSKGARGLMQIMDATGKEVANEIQLSFYHDRSLDDGRINIVLGIHYLAKLINRFDNLKLALEAYNRGPGALKKAIKRGNINPKYSNKVLGYYRKFTLDYLSL